MAPTEAEIVTAHRVPMIGFSFGDSKASGWQGRAAAYLDALAGAGATAITLPAGLSGEPLLAALGRLQGLLLGGGPDVAPELYGEKAGEHCGQPDRQRDRDEPPLLAAALAMDLPLLAICRGVQMLNVALGGTLFQDLRSQVEGALPHAASERGGKERPDVIVHSVNLAPGSTLAGCLGGLEVPVNSRHHQAVKGVAASLRAVAWAPDGVIEALEMPGRRFVVGVQWHPEDLVKTQEHARSLFACLVAAARERL